MVRLLLIDNYDSYTYNLYQVLREMCEVDVFFNNSLTNEEVKDILHKYDGVVISPGPGNPTVPSDVGIASFVIQTAVDIPIFGICLGHQLIGHLHGLSVSRLSFARHGIASSVSIVDTEDTIFANIPQNSSVIRYHSLIVSYPIQNDLIETAFCIDDDGTRLCMALRHAKRPLWGVQFHPESVGTTHGAEMIRNFARFCQTNATNKHLMESNRPISSMPLKSITPLQKCVSIFKAPVDTIPFSAISSYCKSKRNVDGSSAFVLDSCQHTRGGFTYFGCVPQVNVRLLTNDAHNINNVILDSKSFPRTSLWAHLKTISPISDSIEVNCETSNVSDLSVLGDFVGGYVVLFSYDLLFDDVSNFPCFFDDCVGGILEATEFFAIDEKGGSVYAVSYHRPAFELWKEFEATPPLQECSPLLNRNTGGTIHVQGVVSKSDYYEQILRSQEEIQKGETYEICLTNEFRAHVPLPIESLDLYETLRKVNPAPFAAYLEVGSHVLCCSSPERFLHMDASGNIETKPIKGTVHRSSDPEVDVRLKTELSNSIKDRCENMMITDLLRNDLGRVCNVGSVHVPSLMAIESYATVHQMVTTIHGHLKEGLNAWDLFEAAFPGGSITGAPKVRTMQILKQLEQRRRGWYTGSLGYVGYNGACDTNIVIRTIMMNHKADDREVRMGAGGAITALSTAEGEYEEILVKVKPLCVALARYATGMDDGFTIQ